MTLIDILFIRTCSNEIIRVIRKHSILFWLLDSADSDKSEKESAGEQTSADDDSKSDTTDAQSDTTECLNLQLCKFSISKNLCTYYLFRFE